MTRDVSLPLAADDPVETALKDPAIRGRLFGAARSFLGKLGAGLSPAQTGAEAEVVLQDAVERALELRHRYDSSRDVVRWIVGIVRNVAREWSKKRSRAGPVTSDSAVLDSLAVDRARPVADTVADALLVRQLLERLPAIDRAILQMRYCEERTCAEIGQQMGMNEDAVRVRAHRAREQLRRWGAVTGEGQS